MTETAMTETDHAYDDWLECVTHASAATTRNAALTLNDLLIQQPYAIEGTSYHLLCIDIVRGGPVIACPGRGLFGAEKLRVAFMDAEVFVSVVNAIAMCNARAVAAESAQTSFQNVDVSHRGALQQWKQAAGEKNDGQRAEELAAWAVYWGPYLCGESRRPGEL